jgi:hypothetical protein
MRVDYRFSAIGESGFGCQGVEVLNPETSYETTPKLHGLLMINLAALATGRNSEPQNVEGWNRFAQSF